ncbi:MAG: hypothetical protein JOZ10_19025 [Acidobacteria bacterium]|nr:hypothetical protein [Acidobacteriota bacterium]MBV9145885.1 hypothetical protein [Acidobacteriota bacterium]MBV9436565.1 hypothetical protein [Acidobacteriota bacterium]
MPVVLKINPQKKVVHSTFFGVMTDREILEHSNTIASHPDFRPEFDEIIDLTMVTEPRVTSTGMRQLADRQSIFQTSSKHVIVAPKDLSFEKAAEFKGMSETSRPNLTVARSAAEAYRILGLE